MSQAEPTVFIVDDDAQVRESLKDLIRSVGLRVELFASAQEFLRAQHPDGPTCLVLDVRMLGLSGFDLQKQASAAGLEIPIIFITGHGDIPMTVRAMKAGAELGISEKTVKIQQHQVMEKMGVRSLPELVRMADSLGTIGRKS